ncbi:MAG: hypothetical protein ACEQSB_07185 [Undibacterium sp.]
MMKRATSLALLLFFGLVPLSPAVAFQPIVSTPVIQDIKLTAPITKLNFPLKAANTEAFCTQFAETKSKLETALSEKDARVKDYLGGLVENLGDRRANRDAKREGLRSEADQKRSAWYERLNARAKTDAEKDAVLKYQERVEEAVDDRREEVDDAIKSYRESVDTLVEKRRATIESARLAFHTNVLAAITTVEQGCTNGAATLTITKNFKTALSAARTKLAADKKSASMLEGQIQSLVETRKKSVTAAFAQYEAALKAAKADLIAAFQK